MVTSCCAYGCSYRYQKGNSIGIYRFPKEELRRKLWINAVKREKWMPTPASRICGQHFQTGKPSKDRNHPDFIPNVFAYKKQKNSAQLYEKRIKSSTKRKSTVPMRGPSAVEQEAAASLLLLRNYTDPVEVQASSSQDSDLINSLYTEISNLRNEKYFLQKKIQMMDPTQSILCDNSKLLMHTGLQSIELFNWILKVVGLTDNNSLSAEAQLLAVLMKLKLNLLSSYIAGYFHVSKSTISRVFDQVIPLMAGKFKSLITWPTRKALKNHMPNCFKNSKYSKTVCIIDCTEVPIQRSGNTLARSQTWSNYKQNHTIKFLVAVIPSGHICFVSEAWGGRVSDKELTIQSGFLDNIRPGDLVLADRGFILNQYFENKGAKLVVPSFLKGRKQLSKKEVFESKKISNVRIHVERVIRQIKRYRIMQTSIPISFLKHTDSIIIICAALSNLSPSIVKH